MRNEMKMLTVLLSVESAIVSATVFGQSEALEKRFEALAKDDLAELFANPPMLMRPSAYCRKRKKRCVDVKSGIKHALTKQNRIKQM